MGPELFFSFEERGKRRLGEPLRQGGKACAWLHLLQLTSFLPALPVTALLLVSMKGPTLRSIRDDRLFFF